MAHAEKQGRASLASSYGADRSWGGTPNRNHRLAPAHNASPVNGLLWHARKRFGPDVDLDSLTPDQLKQVENDKRAWQKEMSLRGIKARRAQKDARTRVEWLREKSDRLRAEADALEALGQAEAGEDG